MMTTLNQASPALAQEYSLTQAEYHALVHGFEIARKFNPPLVILQDSKLIAFTEGHMAVIHADYHPPVGEPLVKPLVTMAFAPDKVVIKNAKAIRGAGNVLIRCNDGHYHIQGDHTGTRFEAIPAPTATFTLPAIDWIGAEVAGYDPKDLSAYIGKVGKKSKAVHLAVYDDQLEQVWVNGASGPYTFTAGMAQRLAGRRPDVVLLSKVAFRFIGHKQSLRLGKLDDQYFLRATTPIDMGVDLVVTEHLEIVPGC